MFDRAAFAGLVLCLTIATQPAAAQSEASESYRITALELLEYLRTGSRLDVLKKAIVDREIKRDKRMKEFRPELLAHVNKYMPWEDVRESLVSAYTTAFTEEELKAILAFYQSPAGVKVLNHMERLIKPHLRPPQNTRVTTRMNCDSNWLRRLRSKLLTRTTLSSSACSEFPQTRHDVASGSGRATPVVTSCRALKDL